MEVNQITQRRVVYIETNAARATAKLQTNKGKTRNKVHSKAIQVEKSIVSSKSDRIRISEHEYFSREHFSKINPDLRFMGWFLKD